MLASMIITFQKIYLGISDIVMVLETAVIYSGVVHLLIIKYGKC